MADWPNLAVMSKRREIDRLVGREGMDQQRGLYAMAEPTMRRGSPSGGNGRKWAENGRERWWKSKFVASAGNGRGEEGEEGMPVGRPNLADLGSPLPDRRLRPRGAFVVGKWPRN